MHPTTWSRWVGLALAALALAGALAWQWREGEQLRAELARRRFAIAEAARLQAEHDRLLAAQPAPDEAAARQADRAALTGLLADLSALRQRTAQPPRPADPAPARAEEPAITKEAVAASAWRDRGLATPDAAFETALWAGSRGELDRLAGAMVLSDEARAEAASVWTRLPANLRVELDSPEKYVALLAAQVVPTGSAHVAAVQGDESQVRLGADITDEDGQPRSVALHLRAANGAWRIEVSAAGLKRLRQRGK